MVESTKISVGRGPWVAFFVLVVVPLYAVAVTICIRSGLFRFDSGQLTADQYKALWAFIGAGLAAGATTLGAIVAKSQNDRNLAFQKEVERNKEILEANTNERLKLDTVMSGLKVIGDPAGYGPKAAIAGGLAALVQLGHPIIAMRTLAAANVDGVVDPDTIAWLVGNVLTTTKTTGTAADLDAAREEAASMLRSCMSILTGTKPGHFSWPVPVTAKWPSGLTENVGSNLIFGLGELLVSQSKDWWDSGGTYTWIIFTLDEVVQKEPNSDLKNLAARLGVLILDVTDDQWIVGLEGYRATSDVRDRMGSHASADVDKILEGSGLKTKIRKWGEDTRSPTSQS